MKESVHSNTILAEFGQLWFRDHSILQVEFNPEIEVGRKQVNQLLNIVGKLDQTAPKPLLIDLRAIKRINPESVRALLSLQKCTFKRQSAVLVNSPTTRWLVNIIGRLLNTPLNLRSFTREDSAMEWVNKAA